jgi:hypothetical protein
VSFIFAVAFAATLLFVSTILLMRIGATTGARRIQRVGSLPGTAAIDAAVFALLGLLIAFTFSGAAERFNARNRLAIDEANAIGVAYYRLDLLPSPARQEVQALFRRYLDSRIKTYRLLPDVDAALAELAKSKDIQKEIWNESFAALQTDGGLPSAPMLVLPALNTMFDLANTRAMVTRIHPPETVYVMLFVVTLVAAMLAGFGMSDKPLSKIHVVGFAAVMAVAVFVILDLEFPRLGVFRSDAFDRMFVELRAEMR